MFNCLKRVILGTVFMKLSMHIIHIYEGNNMGNYLLMNTCWMSMGLMTDMAVCAVIVGQTSNNMEIWLGNINGTSGQCGLWCEGAWQTVD